jgi:Cof subfamily protein (haloacid dehalogenase superfamily)
MGYKLVFSDIDGTLLNSNHQISRGTKESVWRLKEKGIPFILVSARMPRGIFPLQEELKINEPVICFNGALVLGRVESNGTRKVLFNKALEPGHAKEIHQLITKHFPKVSFSSYDENNWYVSSTTDEWVIQEQEITGTTPQAFHFSDHNNASFNKLMCMGSTQEIDALEVELKKKYSEIMIYKSKPTYLEIMAQNVQKSSAIHLLMQYYKVSKEDVMAIGDNYNDMDMLRIAGLGVAMGNSPADVKTIADITTLSNDQDGLKVAIENYCLAVG